MLSINGTTITLTRGDTLQVVITMKDANNNVYTPVHGDVIRFALKKRYEDARPLIHKIIDNNDLMLVLEPSDTKHLSFGEYVYDIEITFNDGTVDTFISEATFILSKEVM